MISAKYTLIICSFFMLSNYAFAQRRYNAKEQDYTCVVMQKKNYLGGLGIRAGDPMGATLKMYFLKRYAVEAVAGYAMAGINGKFHEKAFRDAVPQTDITYAGHEVVMFYGFNSRILMHSSIPGGMRGLDWYFGIGAQTRIIEGKHDYFTRSEFPKLERISIRNIDLGPEAILGVEFAFPRSPFSSFGEVSLFAKVNEPQFFILPQGGVGIRYNF
jgi:hypothetical protein